jgi:hypothetical protein
MAQPRPAGEVMGSAQPDKKREQQRQPVSIFAGEQAGKQQEQRSPGEQPAAFAFRLDAGLDRQGHCKEKKRQGCQVAAGIHRHILLAEAGVNQEKQRHPGGLHRVLREHFTQRPP